MDLSPILNPLNEAQREAVTAPLGPVFVLAGAGSGKTRVLTHRIVWVIQSEGASPHGILAVTFTNKAAGEMRGRVEQLLGIPGGGLVDRDFPRHCASAPAPALAGGGAGPGIPDPGFGGSAAADQEAHPVAESRRGTLGTPRGAGIHQLEQGRGAEAPTLKDGSDPTRHQLIKLYAEYETACARAGVVDFAELLLRAFELWRDNAAVLAHYRRRFRHVLVDEFQDTNAIQYGWMKLLVGSEGYPFAVGDDDQSIYRWRGARVENLHQYRRDFPTAKLCRLEQNYRSTGAILAAANGLIANNAGRLGKNLWTSGERGDPIRLYAAFNERDEAEFVTHRIRDWVAHGGQRREIAILYRSNAQSRVFEEAFLSGRIPYKVYGGLRFFERAEIKDALAYLRLVSNRRDDQSFERVVNLPTRGIGAKSLDIVREYAKGAGCSLWEAAAACISGQGSRAQGRHRHEWISGSH